MKKIILAITLGLSLALTACGGSNTTAGTDSVANDSDAQAVTEEAGEAVEGEHELEAQIIEFMDENGMIDCMYPDQYFTFTYQETGRGNGSDIVIIYDNIAHVAGIRWYQDDVWYAHYIVGNTNYYYKDGVYMGEDTLFVDGEPDDYSTVFQLIPDIATSCHWVETGYGNYSHTFTETDDGYVITKSGSGIEVTLNVSKEGVPVSATADFSSGLHYDVFEYTLRDYSDEDYPDEVKAASEEVSEEIAKLQEQAAEAEETEKIQEQAADAEAKLAEAVEGLKEAGESVEETEWTPELESESVEVEVWEGIEGESEEYENGGLAPTEESTELEINTDELGEIAVDPTESGAELTAESEVAQ